MPKKAGDKRRREWTRAGYPETVEALELDRTGLIMHTMITAASFATLPGLLAEKALDRGGSLKPWMRTDLHGRDSSLLPPLVRDCLEDPEAERPKRRVGRPSGAQADERPLLWARVLWSYTKQLNDMAEEGNVRKRALSAKRCISLIEEKTASQEVCDGIRKEFNLLHISNDSLANKLSKMRKSARVLLFLDRLVRQEYPLEWEREFGVGAAKMSSKEISN